MKQQLLFSLKVRRVLNIFTFCVFLFTGQKGFTQNPGDLDLSFNSTQLGFDTGTGANGTVYSTVIQPDSKILIGGVFTAYNGVSIKGIARLNANGFLDATFNPGTGISNLNSVKTIALQTDGKILIGGNFYTYNGIARSCIARLNADGSLDTSFNPGTGATGGGSYVHSIVVQADGKIIIGGNFTSYNGTARNRIARLNADGSLDTSFNIGTGANNLISSIVLKPNGKIFIGGSFTSYNSTIIHSIALLNTDGSLDSAFVPGTAINSVVGSVVLQADEKIIIGGAFTSYSGTTTNGIARLNSDGTLDTTFNSGTGANDSILTAALQADGKILIGGQFYTFDGITRYRIARLNVNGSLDTAFNPGGTSNYVESIALQPDGKILLNGKFSLDNQNNFFRLNADGTLDVTFNTHTGVNNDVNSMIKQPDGKILIGGTFTTYNGNIANHILRLNTDGSLDASFNSGSGIADSIPDSAGVRTIVVQPDGKILIGGWFSSFNGTAVKHIARLNSDGTLDTSFNTGGSGVTGTYIHSIVLQPDGKILIGGFFYSYNGTTKYHIARLNPDGSLDTAFIPSGMALNQNDGVFSIALQPDDKILIGGYFSYAGGIERGDIIRLNTDGTLDTSFNPGGTGANTDVFCIAIQPDGKILIGGGLTGYNGVGRLGIARLNADGTLDLTFNSGMDSSNYSVRSIAMQADGRMIIGGRFFTYDGTTRSCLVRLNPYGDLDTSFNLTGINYQVKSIIIQTDDKILISGDFTTYNGAGRNRIARLHGGGVYVDPGFEWSVGANGTVRSIVVQPDNKILIGGYFTTYHHTAINPVARLNADGPIDTTFSSGVGANSTVHAIVMQPDGKILIGGNFTSYNGITKNYIARLNNDRTLDASFNSGTGAGSYITSIALQVDGKILIGGNFTSYNGITKKYIARLNTDGSLDTSFNTGTGISVFPVNCITVQPDGKILIGGQFTTYNGVSRNRIARLNADGSLDTSFNPGTGANNLVLCIKLQSDGKILITGSFTSYNGTTVNRIARLNTDGTLDTTLNFGTGANNIINDMVFQTNGKILIVGAFTSFNGTTANRIARLNIDGSLDTTLDFGTGTNGQVFSVALQSDNKILIGGTFTSYNGVQRKNIAQIDNNDSNFSPGTGANQAIYSIASQPDNKIVIGGFFTAYNGLDNKRVARLNADGSLDNSFVSGNGFDGSVFSLNLQSDGKIIAGGYFSTYNGVARNNIARLNNDGSLDASFNPGSGTNEGIVSTALQADGKILIGGDFLLYNGVQRNGIARLNPDGTLDTTFNPGLGTNNQFVRTIAVQSDGKILIGGNFILYNGASRNYIARLNSDGTLDPTFNSNTGASSPVRTIVLQPDGKILVGGDFISFNGVTKGRIARLNSDGSLDGTFVGVGANQSVSTIALQSNGKMLIGGTFTAYEGNSKNYIAYLNADGTLNSTLDLGTGFNNTVAGIVIRSNNKAIVVGSFTSYNGIEKNRIAELDFNALGVEDQQVTQQYISIYSKNGYIEVVSEEQLIHSIDIFDMRGVNLYSNYKINSLTHSIPSQFLGNQIVIVKVMNQTGETSTKKIICN